MTLVQRLAALWDYLGLGVAHLAAQMPADVASFVSSHAERVAGMVLCTPTRLDPSPFVGVSDRVLMITAEHGLTAEATERALARLPGSQRQKLRGYDAPAWADVVADRTDDVGRWMIEFLKGFDADRPPVRALEGTVAGLSYRISGEGPALVLCPLFLAPSQWEPAIPLLSRHFTVITLGGQFLGGIAALEDRARAPSYQAMVRSLMEQMRPQPGESILDVGCGSGALDRMIARLLGSANRITAVDVNAFLQREAAVLTEKDGLGDAIMFHRGSAEQLPFANGTFDCAFTVTVLEECDADQAIGELWRVLRPGGRAGIVVRAIDMPQWWNLDLPAELRRHAETPPQSIAARGVADASLYRRMRAAGFGELVCFPWLVTLDRPDGPIWRHREDHVLSLLNAEETREWRALSAVSREQGILVMAHPMHCVVGMKPASSSP